MLYVQATVETVIKVSGNKRQEPEPEPVQEPPVTPAPPPVVLEPESTLESIIHHSWGHRHDRKEVPEVWALPLVEKPPGFPAAISGRRVPCTKAAYLSDNCWRHSLLACTAQVQLPPPVPAATPAAALAKDKKQRERSRMEANVESEVDRLIDSQDNEYVLSRPKCALTLPGHTSH